MKTKLKMRCSACDFWNRFETERLVAQQDTSEAEAKIVYPVYSPLKLETCKKAWKDHRRTQRTDQNSEERRKPRQLGVMVPEVSGREPNVAHVDFAVIDGKEKEGYG